MESVESKKNETNPDHETTVQEDRGRAEWPDNKVCNCQRSKCLKLYCECFASGVFCEEGRCACKDCLNNTDYEDTVEEVRERIEQRDPLAFGPTIVNPPDDSPNITGDGNSTNISSARNRKGCKCQNSKCLKKYCGCYRVKVGCSDICRCKDCDNSFGKKSPVEPSALSPKQPCSSEEESSVLGKMEDASDDVDTDYVMSDWCPFLFDDVLDKTGDGDVPDSVMKDSNPTNPTECESPNQPTDTSSSCPPTSCNSEDHVNQTETDHDN